MTPELWSETALFVVSGYHKVVQNNKMRNEQITRLVQLWRPKIHSGQICTYRTFLCTVYIYNSLYENELSFAIPFMMSVPPPYPWILSLSPAA